MSSPKKFKWPAFKNKAQGVDIEFNGKTYKVSKREKLVYDYIIGSKMSVRWRADPLGNVEKVVITVTGPAARIPSVSNSRMNWYPNKQFAKSLQNALTFKNWAVVREIQLKLSTSRVTSMIAPEYQGRIEALTRLWEAIDNKPPMLQCDGDAPWLVTVHLHQDLNRVDSNNLTKVVGDWLQSERVGLIKNDKHIDIYPSRNLHHNSVPNPEALHIALKPLSLVNNECNDLIRAMLT